MIFTYLIFRYIHILNISVESIYPTYSHLEYICWFYNICKCICWFYILCKDGIILQRSRIEVETNTIITSYFLSENIFPFIFIELFELMNTEAHILIHFICFGLKYYWQYQQYLPIFLIYNGSWCSMEWTRKIEQKLLRAHNRVWNVLVPVSFVLTLSCFLAVSSNFEMIRAGRINLKRAAIAKEELSISSLAWKASRNSGN